MKTRVLQTFSEDAPYAARVEKAVRAYCDANGFEYVPKRVESNGRYWFSLDPIRDSLAELDDGDRLIYLDGSAYFFDVALTPEKTIYADGEAAPVLCGAYCECETERWDPRRGRPGALAFVVGAAAREFVADWIDRAERDRDLSPRSRDSFWRTCERRRGDAKILPDYWRFAARGGYFVRIVPGTRSERDAATARIFGDSAENGVESERVPDEAVERETVEVEPTAKKRRARRKKADDDAEAEE